MRDEYKTKLKQANTNIKGTRTLIAELLADVNAELKDLPEGSDKRDSLVEFTDILKDIDVGLESVFDVDGLDPSILD